MWDVIVRRWLDLLFWWAPKKDKTPRRAEQEARKRGPEIVPKAAQSGTGAAAAQPVQRSGRAASRHPAKPAAGGQSAAKRGTAPPASAARSAGPGAAEPGAASEPQTAPSEKAVTAPVPDDLTVIKGIGPALQNRLRALGITTFADLAAANPD